MSTLQIWTIVIGSAMILASFGLGWVKNRRSYCVIQGDREVRLSSAVKNCGGAIFLFFLTSGFGNDISAFWQRIDPFAEHFLVFITWLLSFAAYVTLLVLANRWGYTCGKKYTAARTEAQMAACAEDLNCVLSCPRACHGCPLSGKILKIQRITVSGNPGTEPHGDKGKDLYYYSSIKNLRTGESGCAVEQKGKNGKYYFTPMPTYEKPKS